MKIFLTAAALLIMSLQAFTQVQADTLKLADPTIFPYKDKFYLYGTGSPNGFQVYVSDDLKSWKLSKENEGYALRKGDAFGQSGFWAPQVFVYNNKFYMAYTANEQLAIAEADSPLGPFAQKSKEPLAGPTKQIDPFVFIDDDGKKYLYHVRLTNGNRIFVAELSDDLLGVKLETARECISGVDEWENTRHVTWPVTEGPTVLKHENVYYLFYSANDFRNPDYAVGYATSSSPLGPWKKHAGNPILVRKMLGINGTGHGDLFKTGNQWYYVFHMHNSNSKVSPRKTALIKAKLVKGKPDSWELISESSTFMLAPN